MAQLVNSLGDCSALAVGALALWVRPILYFVHVSRSCKTHANYGSLNRDIKINEARNVSRTAAKRCNFKAQNPAQEPSRREQQSRQPIIFHYSYNKITPLFLVTRKRSHIRKLACFCHSTVRSFVRWLPLIRAFLYNAGHVTTLPWFDTILLPPPYCPCPASRQTAHYIITFILMSCHSVISTQIQTPRTDTLPMVLRHRVVPRQLVSAGRSPTLSSAGWKLILQWNGSQIG